MLPALPASSLRRNVHGPIPYDLAGLPTTSVVRATNQSCIVHLRRNAEQPAAAALLSTTHPVFYTHAMRIFMFV